MFLLATGASVGGIFTQPALAECTVDGSEAVSTVYNLLGDEDPPADTCGGDGYCTVNLGSCTDGGACTVNSDIGDCNTNGACTINDGRCSDGACTIASGDCSNHDDALICLNTVCDDMQPGSDSESYSGFICIWNGGSEASVQDPDLEQGEITAGPWVVRPSDPATNTIFNVTMTCTMRDAVGSTHTTGTALASRSNTTSGNVGILADLMSFRRPRLTVTHLCTVVEWNSTKGHTVLVDDADNDTTNGYQCIEYTYTN